MMRSEPKKYQFTPDYKLVCALKDTSFEGILDMAKSVLQKLVPGS
jgi:transcription-repair coupling factor (superfamily II helicase)